MALYAFAIKDARQYLNIVNLVQTYKGESLVEQRLEPCQNGEFGKRIVCGYFKRNFTVAEMNNLFGDVPVSAGATPPAEGYFQHYQSAVEVHTGGLSIQNLADMQPIIREFMQEYTDGKLLDEAAFHHVKRTWYEALKNLGADNLPGDLSQPTP